MLHRFLQHNLAVIILEAAYMDGYKNGRGLDKGEASGRAWSFAKVAVAAAPPELHCHVNLPHPPMPDLEDGAVAYVVPDKPPGVETLVEKMWMQGYHNRTSALDGLDFKAWVRQMRKQDERPEDEIEDQAYEAAIEIIRKHKHLMAIEYKPKWMLMVAEDCSIGDYCGDQPAAGDFIEYGLHTVCEVVEVDHNARRAIVKRMNCCSSDSCLSSSDDRGVPRRAPLPVVSNHIVDLAQMAKEHPILDEMLKQIERNKQRDKLNNGEVVSSAGVGMQDLNIEDEIARLEAEIEADAEVEARIDAEIEDGAEAEKIKTPKSVTSSISGTVEMGDQDNCNSEVQVVATHAKPAKPKIPLSQIKPAGFYKSEYTIVIDDISINEDANHHPAFPRNVIVYPWKPVNVDILPPEKVAKSLSLRQLIRDEMLLSCSEEEAAKLQSDYNHFGHPLSASNTLGVLDKPVEDYVNTRTGTIRDEFTPDDVDGDTPLTSREMEAYAAVGLGNVLEGFKKKMKITGAAVGPEDALLEVAVGKSKRPAPKRAKKPKKRKSAKK